MKTLTDGGGTGTYTETQLQDRLLGPSATIGLRIEVLDENREPIGQGADGELSTVHAASLDVDGTRLIPSALKLSMLPDPLLEDVVSPFTRYLRPWWGIGMLDGGWAEWPQGVYPWTQPARKIAGDGAETWDVVLGDLSHLLSLTGPDVDGFTVGTRSNVTAQISAIYQRSLGATVDLSRIEQSDAVTPGALFWSIVSGQPPSSNPPPGAGLIAGAPATSWQTIIKTLLTGIGYQPPRFDWLGAPVAQPFPLNLFAAPAALTVGTDDTSILEPGVTVTPRLDLFANRVVAYANNASANAYQGNAVADANDYLPGHPWSQAECGQYVSVAIPNGVAGDARTLLAHAVGELYVRMALALEATIETQMWPTLEPWDVLAVDVDGYTTTPRFLASAYSVDLLTGRMKFRLPKITGT